MNTNFAALTMVKLSTQSQSRSAQQKMTGHYDWSYAIHNSMSITINATQAKAELLSLIDRVANGESGPVTITKHGKAKVMLVPAVEAKPKLERDTFFGWAAMSMHVPEEVDLTEPVWGDDWIEARDGDATQWLF